MTDFLAHVSINLCLYFKYYPTITPFVCAVAMLPISSAFLWVASQLQDFANMEIHHNSPEIQSCITGKNAEYRMDLCGQRSNVIPMNFLTAGCFSSLLKSNSHSSSQVHLRVCICDADFSMVKSRSQFKLREFLVIDNTN